MGNKTAPSPFVSLYITSYTLFRAIGLFGKKSDTSAVTQHPNMSSTSTIAVIEAAPPKLGRANEQQQATWPVMSKAQAIVLTLNLTFAMTLNIMSVRQHIHYSFSCAGEASRLTRSPHSRLFTDSISRDRPANNRTQPINP